MAKQKVTDFTFTKDEIREIFSQALQALEEQNFHSLPAAILQAWANMVVDKTFSKFRGECEKSVAEFIAEVEKAAEKFDNEIKPYLMK